MWILYQFVFLFNNSDCACAEGTTAQKVCCAYRLMFWLELIGYFTLLHFQQHPSYVQRFFSRFFLMNGSQWIVCHFSLATGAMKSWNLWIQKLGPVFIFKKLWISFLQLPWPLIAIKLASNVLHIFAMVTALNPLFFRHLWKKKVWFPLIDRDDAVLGLIIKSSCEPPKSCSRSGSAGFLWRWCLRWAPGLQN